MNAVVKTIASKVIIKNKGIKMAISSINIQIATIFALLHNLRVAIVSYTIAKADRNDCNRSVEEAYAYYLALLKEAISNYTSRTGQQIQTNEKKFLWEVVINLNENHTLEDLEELAVVLEKTYGWRSLQNSIHRDEGHIDLESGQKIYNYHAHILFFMLDEQGIYRFKKRDFGIKKMVELQTLTAKVLKMERGISKKITKKVGLDHRQYRQVAREKAKMQKKINELKSENSEQNMENFNLISDLVMYEHEIKENQKKINELKIENESFVTDSEEDKFFMHAQAKELDMIIEQSDMQAVEILELEEEKGNIQKILLDMKENGLLVPNSLLDKYILANNDLAEKNIDQESKLQSTIGWDTEPDDNHGDGITIK